jgi:hypothetical protein
MCAGWCCRNCNHVNKMPTENAKDCSICAISWHNLCNFHKGFSHDVTKCAKCSYMIQFSKNQGTPGKVWRKERMLYKSCIIYDAPGMIPENVAPHLRSDIERFMYKQAKRAVQACIDEGCWDNDFQNPRDLMKQLDGISSDYPRNIGKKKMLEELDEILWSACMSLDCTDAGYSPGMTIENMDAIEVVLKDHEDYAESRREKIRNISTYEDAVKVKSQSKRGVSYYVSVGEECCTCPAFEFRGKCKHLQKLLDKANKL